MWHLTRLVSIKIQAKSKIAKKYTFFFIKTLNGTPLKFRSFYKCSALPPLPYWHLLNFQVLSAWDIFYNWSCEQISRREAGRPQVWRRDSHFSLVSLSVSRLLRMRRLGISLDSFERGRHLLCRTAWKQDRQCDPNTLAGQHTIGDWVLILLSLGT